MKLFVACAVYLSLIGVESSEALLPLGSSVKTKFHMSTQPVYDEIGHTTRYNEVNKDALVGWTPFSGLKKDFKRRAGSYKSDWTDGFRKRTLAASLFLYFSCLGPVVAFGGIANLVTEGNIGVVHFVVSSGLSGIFYSIFSGQPMTFVGPTGLTLAFMTTLFRFSKSNSLPFLEVYSWTGLWTAMFLALSSVFNLCNLVQYCTRFTDDCFNALLSMNFLYEAALSLLRNFIGPLADPLKAVVSMNMAVLTAYLTKVSANFGHSKMFNRTTRKFVSSFGPSAVVILMSIFASQPAMKAIGIDKLAVPASFSLSSLLASMPQLTSLPKKIRFLTIIPALLLTMLFYLDQNISVRTINSFDVKKGVAYHLDMLVLSIIVAGLSATGLPWMCAATVQSLNHVRAMSDVTRREEDRSEVISDIVETRLSGLLTHVLILLSVFLFPLLANIPMAVVSGIFLFIGRKLMMGNQMLDRIGYLLVDKSKLPPTRRNVFRYVSTSTVTKFVGIQTAMLGLIWYLKQSKTLALFFPSCIGLLMLTRLVILPRLFTLRDLEVLDSDFVTV